MIPRQLHHCLAIHLLWLGGIAGSGVAADVPLGLAKPLADGVTIELLATGLRSPLALAIRPGASTQRADVYVSESGAGRVVSVATDRPGKIVPQVEGFPLVPWSASDSRQVGPLGLAFVNRRKLLVAAAANEAGKETIRVFELVDGQLPKAASEPVQVLGPVATGDEAPTEPGRLLSIVAQREAFFASCCGPTGGKDSLLRIPLRAGILAPLERFASFRTSPSEVRPWGLTTSGKGYLVVAFAGPPSGEAEGCIGFYSPYDGSALAQLVVPIALSHLAGVAYHSRRNELYAIDANWEVSEGGGVYRIEADPNDQRAATAVPVAKVAHPSAIAFTPDGRMVVTACGDPTDATPDTGALLRITLPSN